MQSDSLGFAAVVGIEYERATGNCSSNEVYITVEIRGSLRTKKLEPGTKCFLRERYVDFNVRKAITNLIQMDKENPNSLFLRLLNDPNKEVPQMNPLYHYC